VTLTGQEDEANEISEGIDQSHDLSGETATRAAYGLILSPPFAPVPCWWTRTSVPSMRTYSKSGSSQRALKTRSQTPAQRQKRVYTVNHLPNASGRSRHGEPVRAIQRTASMKRRPGSPTLPDSCGAIRSHWVHAPANRIVIFSPKSDGRSWSAATPHCSAGGLISATAVRWRKNLGSRG
jgi:hypothetical protein